MTAEQVYGWLYKKYNGAYIQPVNLRKILEELKTIIETTKQPDLLRSDDTPCSVCETEAIKLLSDLEYTIRTYHVDMGGNHRYSLSMKSHKVISEIKGFLGKLNNK